MEIRRKLSKLFNILLLILNGFWAILAVYLLRCIRPLCLIRLGAIKSDRIGHFAADAGIQWIELSQKPINQVDLYWLPKKTCNNQLRKMICRNFKVSRYIYYLDRWNRLLPGGEIHQRPSSNTLSRDTNGLIAKSTSQMRFLPKEENTAREWLRKKGWKDGVPFVCLLVRDSAYLNNDPLHSSEKWDYHSHRDSEIETYVPAMEWLANLGIFILRMGKITNNPIHTKHPKIIDYAFNNEKSDLLDIWLFANCNLCISTGTGLDMISNVYQKPLLMLNFISLYRLWSWNDTTTYPKYLTWEDSGKKLTFQEIIDHSKEHDFARTQDFKSEGIKILDLTEDEILESVQERWMQIQGIWEPQPGDFKRQTEFWKQLKKSPNFSKYHGFIHPKARLSDSFLRKNKNFLDLP